MVNSILSFAKIFFDPELVFVFDVDLVSFDHCIDFIVNDIWHSCMFQVKHFIWRKPENKTIHRQTRKKVMEFRFVVSIQEINSHAQNQYRR